MDDHQQAESSGPAGEDPAEPRPPVDSAPAPVPIFAGEEQPVDPRSVKVARIVAIPLILGIGLLPLTITTIGWAVGGIPSVVYLPLFLGLLLVYALLLLFAYKWPAVRHERLRYLVDEGGLRIRRGVFWRKVIWIPISRVQHTDVSQGPLQRKFELATLTVHTAGTSGASISLEGLEHTVARRLCDQLRPERKQDAT